MADQEDVEALNSGSVDLVRRDFRGIVLRGVLIGARDFSHARLEAADFGKSDLSGSTFKDAHTNLLNVELADLSSSTWHGSIYGVNFRGANLRNSNLNNSLFNHCDFREADLRGASISASTINEENQFGGAIVDETTIFDGTNILRSLARDDAFRYYEVHRGALRRKIEQPEAAQIDGKAAERAALILKIDAVLADLRRLEATETEPALAPGMGHNNPPEETPLDRAEHTSLGQALINIKAEAASADPHKEKVSNAESVLTSYGEKILRWLAGHADAAAGEFAKGLGKNLSDPLKVAAAWMLLAGGLSTIGQMARAFFGF